MEEFFRKLVIDPTKDNLAIVLLWGGIFLVFIGALFGSQIDGFQFIPMGTGEALLKGGSGILGAGVFAVIMKSTQFTELFKKHIYDVFYDPASVRVGVPLIEKWRGLTSALLKDILPTAHNKALDLIQQQFFNSEIEYHFENYKIRYDIAIDTTTNIATITQQTETTIVLSPNAANPRLNQSIRSLSKCTLVTLHLNGKDFSKLGKLENDSNNPNLYKLSLPDSLREYAVKGAGGDDLVVELDRVVSITQDLKIDPYIYVKISRYIKGAIVKAKVSNGFKLHFQKFGLGDLPDNHHRVNDGMGFEEWQIASPDCLLLPGQGFVIVPALL